MIVAGSLIALPVEWSSIYVRNFFPKYYASLGFITFVCVFTAPELLSKILLAICAALFAFSLFYLTEKINAAKDLGQTKRFYLLHGSSVAINLFQLLIFIYLLARWLWTLRIAPLVKPKNSTPPDTELVNSDPSVYEIDQMLVDYKNEQAELLKNDPNA